MALLEEVGEGAEASVGDAEGLKADHRRKRAKNANSKARKKKKLEGVSGPGKAVTAVLLAAAVVISLGLWYRAGAMHRESNSCKMTMSRPEYVQLPVPGYPDQGEAEGDLPGYNYQLARYMDRKLPANDKRDASKPKGVPVLFVPGHLGSFKQVRSLGSHAAEAKVPSSRRRLDIFALDLLEEWSALHGSMIWRQAEFLNHAVEAILALYDDRGSTSSVASVMVVGHSLGGVVARTAFTLPSYRVGTITDIVTLGSPHDRAPWMMDYSVLSLYRCTDSLWRWHLPSPSSSFLSDCWPQSFPSILTDPDSDTAEGEMRESAALRHEKAFVSGKVDTQKEACVVSGDGSGISEGDCAMLSTDVASKSSATADSGSVKSGTAGGAFRPVVGWGGAAGVDAETLLGNTVLLSVSGGANDMMVHPSLCVADGLGLDGQSVSFTTGSVEGCGFGVDHLALVWCKQLVSRVAATLSELERLHAKGAGPKERTRVAAGILASSLARPSEATLSETTKNNEQTPFSLGFEEAANEGDGFALVARSLVTDRSYLLIPAWVCVTALVLAAALTRGLYSKSAKEAALPLVPFLLNPETHLQWNAVKYASRLLWTSFRAKGAPAIVALVTSCGVMALSAVGDDVASRYPGATDRIVEQITLVPGGSLVRIAAINFLRLVGDAATYLVRVLNPFEGARDALRLHPAKGIFAVYVVSTGWMMAFVYLMAMLGTMGNGIRRAFKGTPLMAVLRFMRGRKVVATAACASVLAAHVETFSLPPTFREVSLKGELSLVFLVLSLSLYALLIGLALFPATWPAASTHQRLVLLLYAPAPAVLMGLQLAATGIFLRRGGLHEPFVASGELALASLALVPIIASVWFARRARPFPSPTSIHGFFAELQAQMDEVSRTIDSSAGVSYGGDGARGSSTAALAAAALERPNGHGACGKCLHADGGHGAVFMETDKERVSIGAGVTLGPGFRVVGCDCPQRDRAAPSSWCEFCRCVCKVCGGCKEAAKAARMSTAARGPVGGGGDGTRLSDELRAASAVGLLSVVVLYAGLWAFGMRMMAAPCHSLCALAVMGVIVCALHWGVAKDAANGGRRS